MKIPIISISFLAFISSSCVKNKGSIGTAGKASSVLASLAEETRYEPSLIGYDMSLSLEAFSKLYAAEIESCKDAKYSDEKISNKAEISTKLCLFKNDSGATKFVKYDDKWQIFAFLKSVPTEGIKIRLATEKLEQKTKHSSQRDTFDEVGGFASYCASVVKFYKGRAILMSDNIIYRLHERNMAKGLNGDSCSDDIYLDVDFKFIKYEGTELIERMKIDLNRIRDNEEREKAEGFEL